MARSRQNPRLVAAALLAGAAVLFAIPVIAQDQQAPAGEPPATTSGEAAPALTLAEVEAALAAIEEDSTIADAVKELLRQRYQQAIEALQAAADFTAKAASYREAIQSGPEQAVNYRAETKALPPAEDAARPPATGSSEDLQKDIDSRRAALSALSDNLSAVTSELVRVKGRPVEISARLPEAQGKLSDILKQLSSSERSEDAASPGRVADRVLLQSQQLELVSELEMLKQEQLSQSVREDLLLAQQELLTRQVENAKVALDALKVLLDQQLTSEAQRVTSLADTIPEDVAAGDEAAQALAAEVRGLAQQFEEVVEKSKKVTAAQLDVTARIERLTAEYEFVSEQLKLGGSGGAMAQVLFNLYGRITDARAEISKMQLPDVGQTRLAALDIEEQLRRQPDVEQQFADHSSEAVARLVTTRRDVLEKLRTQYGNLARALARLQGDQGKFLNQAEEFRKDIKEQLFWMRSCPPMSATTLTDIPAGLRFAFNRDGWRQHQRALQWVATHIPLRFGGILLLVAGLLLARRRMVAALEQTGTKVRRISTDRYAYTGAALFWTFLLAIPIPLLMGFEGWALQQTPAANEVLRDTAHGLRLTARVTFVFWFLAEVCRAGGLGAAHFGWKQETLPRIRSAIIWFGVIYIPALWLSISYYLYGDVARYFDSVGRVVFMLAHLWTTIVVWRLFRSADGILATLVRDHPTSLFTRWRYVGFALLMACPIALVVLAGMGYLVTAAELSLGLLANVALIAGGYILYCLALRWFMVKQRKLALAEALERRRERHKAAAAEAPHEPAGEIICVDPEDEEELDLESISEQTQALLRLLFILGVAVAMALLWSETIPLLSVFDTIRVPLAGGLTLLGLAKAILILAVTSIAVKNLPGVLELGVLRQTDIEAGTRYAITTLCKYAVIAIGVLLFFNALQVDWSKFGWIAAALSVGLGFGLQEVVANFVCGLILLFERPIRVGDVVTLEGTTGTVTNISMRATTIRNWDRQDLVVPNKNLITGTILNWTLSAELNRIVIPVGVAYGTDTEKARQILLEIAAEHPRVIDDPAPIATFEQFADSSLNLVLRAYLPNLENRLATITELHTEIDQRFAEAGIEIAFPQQGIHVRSGLEGLRQPDMGDVYGQGSDPA